MNILFNLAAAVLLALLLGQAAHAKLPPLSDEAKAKATETAARNAHTDKLGSYQLCLAQERVAAVYWQAPRPDAKPPVPTPPCGDPGPFVYAPPPAASAPPPLEAAGAHSPAKTATGPPNSGTVQSTLTPTTPTKK